ncbi:MAG: Ig domain-containing protein [Planctomycetota bacterium]|nr:Ig domain-containing protein [Planctomycetota bacterium]
MTSRILLAAPILLALAGCSHRDSLPTGAAATQALVAGPGAPSGLAYAEGRAVYRAGRAIAPNTATVGGTNLAFSIQPPLPSGLVLNPSTGAITGQPSGTSATTAHTVTASNPNGTTTAHLSISVLPFASELDSAQFGEAPAVRLVGAVWGRIVDVYDRDLGTGVSRRIANDLLVREDVATGGLYQVDTNIVTQGTRITILAPLGSAAFANAYDALEANLPTVTPAGPDDLPPFTAIPRNAAIALIFDDLLDPDSVKLETVRVLTGAPSVDVQSTRLRADPNHGNVTDRDGDGRVEYWSTRVLVDPVVTNAEALANPQPIVPDPDGFPAAQSSGETNLLVRIPTVVNPGAGQLEVLRNLSGARLSSTQSGPVDTNSPTVDVVRALRSGGPSAVTGDAYEGFLADLLPPRIVAEIPVTVTSVGPDPLGNAEDKRIALQFANAACAAALRIGDTIQAGRAVLEVLEPSSQPAGASVANVRVKVLQRTTSLTGPATLHARFVLGADAARLGCFLAFDPPAALAPADQVDPAARVILRADEPLDRASLSGMDATRIGRVLLGVGGRQIVPATHEPAADLRGLAIRPLVPLTHASGSSETYFARVDGWRDLAGNTLALPLGAVPFTLDPAAASVASGGITFRFDSNDMLPGAGAPPDGGTGKPEFRGQFLLDSAVGIATGRPVTRFQPVADRTQAVPGLMLPFAPGVSTPISRYGSKLQTLWRYCDLGLGLLDEQFHNVDVEHLYWAPVGGAAIADSVTRFEIGLAHGAALPDESVDITLLPVFPNSGLVATYAQNLADAGNDPLRTVHPGTNGIAGYVVQPTDATVTTTGTTVMPWPLNRGIPLGAYTRYTWRDTALQATGGADGPGAELRIVGIASGQPNAPVGVPYAAGSVPTIGLPLLMEFRCYPDPNALGLNAFDVSIATAASPRPNFRAYSTGGIDAGGSVVIRDPDLQTVATGGFSPGSTPPGAATLPVDNVVQIGALDLVVRVSRMHSIWLDSATAAPSWSVATEPTSASQPAGTEVRLAYRGASNVANPTLTSDASTLDAYGDALSGGQPTFHQGDSSWKSSASGLDGARFLQTRVTFVANAATNRTPTLSALGIAWR